MPLVFARADLLLLAGALKVLLSEGQRSLLADSRKLDF
jgi:hypothetical protein